MYVSLFLAREVFNDVFKLNAVPFGYNWEGS